MNGSFLPEIRRSTFGAFALGLMWYLLQTQLPAIYISQKRNWIVTTGGKVSQSPRLERKLSSIFDIYFYSMQITCPLFYHYSMRIQLFDSLPRGCLLSKDTTGAQVKARAVFLFRLTSCATSLQVFTPVNLGKMTNSTQIVGSLYIITFLFLHYQENCFKKIIFADYCHLDLRFTIIHVFLQLPW